MISSVDGSDPTPRTQIAAIIHTSCRGGEGTPVSHQTAAAVVSSEDQRCPASHLRDTHRPKLPRADCWTQALSLKVLVQVLGGDSIFTENPQEDRKKLTWHPSPWSV